MRRTLKHHIYNCTMKVLFITLVLSSEVISKEARRNDWPTYNVRNSSTHECFMCPPGYYKLKDCILSKDRKPKWPTCIRCPESQFSSSWNVESSCIHHDTCEKNHEEIFNGGKIGPIKCACGSSSLEDVDGVCVEGVTLSEYNAKLKELEAGQSELLVLRLVLACLVSGILIGTICAIISCIQRKRRRKRIFRSHGSMNKQMTHQTSSLGCGTSGTHSLQRSDHGSVIEMKPRRARVPNAGSDSYYSMVSTFSDLEANEETDMRSEFAESENYSGIMLNSFGITTTPQKTEREPRDILDDALRIIEKYTLSIDDADSLMRDVFRFTARECQKVKNENGRNVTDCIRVGFKKWREKNGKEATIQFLLESLRNHGRNFMAEEIVQTFNIEENRDLKSMREERDDGRFDSVVKICEEILTVDDILKEFFRVHLDLTDQTVESLLLEKKAFLRNGLLKWREKNSKENATVEKLIELFEAAGMKNVASQIREEFQGKHPDNVVAKNQSKTAVTPENGVTCVH